MFRTLIAMAVAASAAISGAARAQEVVVTLTHFEFSDFFGTCYPKFALEVTAGETTGAVEVESVTAFGSGGFFGGEVLGRRTCTDDLDPEGGSGFSCTTDGDDDHPCEMLQSVTITGVTCDGSPCDKVTIPPADRLIVE